VDGEPADAECAMRSACDVELVAAPLATDPGVLVPAAMVADDLTAGRAILPGLVVGPTRSTPPDLPPPRSQP
jgi:hypothetical protein